MYCTSLSYCPAPWPRLSALTLVTLAIFLASKKIHAGTTAVGQEEERFLDITESVWTPTSPSEGKVVGQHTFPFSITIPRDVTIAPVPKAAPKSFPLPPTFSERASPAYIDYRLFVTVRRGRLRVNKQCVPRALYLHFHVSLAWQHLSID